jgi:hypothetical protein
LLQEARQAALPIEQGRLGFVDSHPWRDCFFEKRAMDGALSKQAQLLAAASTTYGLEASS